MREKLRAGGGEALADHEILEMLLFYSIPRVNTNETAHRLIGRFGSMSGVLAAKRHELLTVQGIGEQSADLILLMSEFFHRVDSEADKIPRIFQNIDEVAQYVVKELDGLARERVIVLLFTADYRLIATHQISEGSVNTSRVDIRQIMEYAILAKASHIVLAHNHPDPVLIPSQEDVSASISLMHAASTMSINLWEHILVSDGKYLLIMKEMLASDPYAPPFYKQRMEAEKKKKKK